MAKRKTKRRLSSLRIGRVDLVDNPAVDSGAMFFKRAEPATPAGGAYAKDEKGIITVPMADWRALVKIAVEYKMKQALVLRKSRAAACAKK